ncbi:cyclin 10 [Novymonas esmeraldas]|uniref:Cyclin 10 n=1 Tax=Novymonas esmeraldas TaxID=1808958 RepID=A0AAW0ETN0_9TRYP
MSASDAALPNGRGRIGAGANLHHYHHHRNNSHDEDGSTHRSQNPLRLSPAHSPRGSEGCEKPLICSFFARKPLPACLARHSSSLPTTPAEAGGAGGRGVSDETGAAAVGVGGTVVQPAYPTSMEEPIELFPLTPSVTVTQRHSKRSGRVLNESETLQEKHGQEYRFLVPWLAYAIDSTIAAHEALRQLHGIAAHVSPPTSPAANALNGAADGERSPRQSANGSVGPANVGSTNSTANGYGGGAAAPGPQSEFSAFSTREVPAISVHDYLKRVVKYTYVSPSVLVCACLYIDRLLCMHPGMLLHPYNVFKFFLTSTRLASKIMDTRTLNNHDFSVVGGVTNDDLNALEFLMVELLQNRLYFSRETFNDYCRPLRMQAAHLSDEASDWGTETIMETPVDTRSSIPHQPSRPTLARGSGGGAGSNTRSRRSSIISQNEYSMSTASQSGVSPLRSASRPAFPPSASTARSISVDTESLGPARAPASRTGSGSTSGRRQPLGTGYSPALPQVPHATANSGSSPSLGVIGAHSARGSAAALRTSGGEEMVRTAVTVSHANGLSQNGAGAWAGQTPPGPATVPAVVEDRARSIPLSAPRGSGGSVGGAAASWDATGRPIRALASSTTGTSAGGFGTAALNNCRGGSSSPSASTAPALNGTAGSSSQGMTASAEEFGSGSAVMCHGDRTPTRRPFAYTAREGVALPPVARSGRRERSASMLGIAVSAQRVPPPPEQPRA